LRTIVSRSLFAAKVRDKKEAFAFVPASFTGQFAMYGPSVEKCTPSRLCSTR
jgi:hypothetical protein